MRPSLLRLARLVATTLVVSLPALAGAAEEGIRLSAKAEARRIASEDGLVYRLVLPGRSLGARVLGPGDLTLRLRRYLPKGSQPAGILIVVTDQDGKTIRSATIPNSAEADLLGDLGKASAAVLQVVSIGEGEHVVQVKPSGGQLLVAFAFAAKVDLGESLELAPLVAPSTELELAPLVSPAPTKTAEAEPKAAEQPLKAEPLPPPPPPPEERAAATVATTEAPEAGAERTLEAREGGAWPADGADAARPAAARAPAVFSLMPRVGLAVQPQFGAAGLAAGLSLDFGVALERRLAVGLSVDYYSYRIEATGIEVPGRAPLDLSSSMWVVPVLATVTFRLPIGGEVFHPYLGVAGGVFLNGVDTKAGGGLDLPEQSASTVSPGGAGLAGVGVPAGPGRIGLEGRFNVASGEVDGASKGLSAGGTTAQAGYQLVF